MLPRLYTADWYREFQFSKSNQYNFEAESERNVVCRNIGIFIREWQNIDCRNIDVTKYCTIS